MKSFGHERGIVGKPWVEITIVRTTFTFYGASFLSEGYKLLGVSVDTVNGDWQSLDKANHDQVYQTSL